MTSEQILVYSKQTANQYLIHSIHLYRFFKNSTLYNNYLGVRDIPEACTAAVSGPGIPSPPVNADPKSLARSALFICRSADGQNTNFFKIYCILLTWMLNKDTTLEDLNENKTKEKFSNSFLRVQVTLIFLTI